MDQVVEQSVENNVPVNDVPEQSAEPQAESPASAEQEFDARELGSMSQEDQLSALKAAGILGEKPAEPVEEKAEEPAPKTKPEEQSDPLVTVKINGQEMQVKQSELIAGYQRGADYTRKTQELAAERRRYDELLEKMASGNIKKPEPPSTRETIQAQYEAATAEAERIMGIGAGEYNQFDPQHQFVLQQVMMHRNTEELAQKKIASEIQDFVNQARQDPLSPQVDAAFDDYIFKMGASGVEGQEKAMILIAAKARFMAKQATKQDCDLLKAHWNYVRSALTAQAAPAISSKKQVEPPATEAPGVGKQESKSPRLDKKKLGSLRGDDQLAYLKKMGIFG